MAYIKTNFEAENVRLGPLLATTKVKGEFASRLPGFIDNRELCLPPNNQGEMPSCTGFAVAGYFEVLRWAKTGLAMQLDATKIYKQSKQIDGIPEQDGSYIDAALRAATILGYAEPLGTEKLIARIDCSITEIKRAIHRGRVFVGAFAITSDWNYVSTKGIISSKWNAVDIGGHAVLVVGYNDKGIWIQNSWGFKNWGLKGFAFLSWKQVQQQFAYGVQLI